IPIQSPPRNSPIPWASATLIPSATDPEATKSSRRTVAEPAFGAMTRKMNESPIAADEIERTAAKRSIADPNRCEARKHGGAATAPSGKKRWQSECRDPAWSGPAAGGGHQDWRRDPAEVKGRGGEQNRGRREPPRAEPEPGKHEPHRANNPEKVRGDQAH